MAAGDNARGPRTSDHRKCRTNPKPKRRIKSLGRAARSEEHTSELQSQPNLVCRLLLDKKTIAALSVAVALTTLVAIGLFVSHWRGKGGCPPARRSPARAARPPRREQAAANPDPRQLCA